MGGSIDMSLLTDTAVEEKKEDKRSNVGKVGNINSRPNVIVCMCDQLRSFEVGCYGNEVVKTPHIDSLAANGARFDIAISNNPVCTPARSSLLTGQYSRTCAGYLGNEGDEAPPHHRKKLLDITMPEAFKQAGYRTALIGKWHIAPHPKLVGFDEYLFPKLHHLNYNQIYFDESGRGFTARGLAEDFNCARLKSFLEKRARSDKPFFVFYNIATPHMPFFDVPQAFTAMYSKDDVSLRDNVFIEDKMAYDEHWFKIYLWDYLYYQGFFQNNQFGSPFKLPPNFDLRDLTALYYGMVSFTDKYVGRIINLLRKYSLFEDTIFVFTSDHGDNLGSHHRFNKGLLIEESIRIPLIISDACKSNPVENTTQVASLVDLMPTVLALCDIEIPSSVQGNNLGPILKGERDMLDVNCAFIETSSRDIGIRTPTHLYGMKLADDFRTVNDDRLYFYDLTVDPYEQNNLAKTDAQSNTAQILREKLIEWNENTKWLQN